MKNILIVGAGNLGRRHFQSLAKYPEEATIQVLDTSSDALGLAKELFNASSPNPNIKAEYITSFEQVQKNVSLAIIATSSVHRYDVIQLLLQKANVEYLVLEKFLFTKPDEYEKANKLLAGRGIKTWVNCPRRLFPFYQKLKEEIEGPVYMNVFGSNWGLACNSIHFLDLHYYLSGNSDLEYEVPTNSIRHEIVPSKREGYVEFMGTLNITSSDTSVLNFTCLSSGTVPLSINLESPTHKIYINEGSPGKVMIARAKDNWSWNHEEMSIMFQSQLTLKLAEELFQTGACTLPEYSESQVLHLRLLNAFIDKSKEILNSNTIDQCLIT